MTSLPLTESQRLIWVDEAMAPGTSAHVICGAVVIEEALDVDRLVAAVARCLADNDAFQIVLDRSTTEPRQRVEPTRSRILVVDLRADPDHLRALRVYGTAAAAQAIPLFDGPLYEVAVLRLAGDRTGLLLRAHHLIADAYAVLLFLRWVARHHRDGPHADATHPARRGVSALLDEERRYLASPRYTSDRTFWAETLKDLDGPTLLGASSPSQTVASRAVRTWSPAQSRAFEGQPSSAVWAAAIIALGSVIGHVLGRSRSCIGSPYFNRRSPAALRTFGMCVNTIPVVADTTDAALRCLEHAAYPFLHHRAPRLFDVAFSLQNTRFAGASSWQLSHLEWFFPGHQVNALTVHMHDRGGSGVFGFDLDHRGDVLDTEQVDRLFEAFTEAAQAVVRGGTAAPRQHRYAGRTAGLREPVDRWFRRTVERNPGAIALDDGNERVSYRELDARIDAASSRLGREGVRPGQQVVVEASRTISTIVEILAIGRGGAAWVPIPTGTTAERRCHILAAVAAAEPIADLAYVLFTSGTTGGPKGVSVSHQALAHYLDFAVGEYARGVPTSMPLFTSLGFDLTLTSVFVPLLSGGTLSIVPEGLDDDGRTLEHILSTDASDAIKLTPSHLRLIDALGVHTRRLRTFIVGGEALSHDLVRRVARRMPVGTRFVNEYGPTEATVGCVVHDVVDSDRGEQAPIGRPIPGTTIRIVNPRGEDQLPGFRGELHIAGPGLALRYSNDDGQTARAFYEHDGERWYRTGDDAVERDGVLHYLGRRDRQIKRNGHRIELPELEAALERCDGIEAGRFVLLPADNLLLAFYSGRPWSEPELRRALSAAVQVAAQPNAMVHCPSMPLTRNGKIDDDALVELWRSRASHEGTPAAGTSAQPGTIERRVQDVVAQVLAGGPGEASASDLPSRSFLAAGGDSVAAIQVVARLRGEGIRLSVAQLMSAPTVAAASGLAALERPDVAAEADHGVLTELPPMYSWLRAQSLVEPRHYHQSVLLELRTPASANDIQRALAELARTHDALRLVADTAGALTFAGEVQPPLDVFAIPRSEPTADFIREHAGRIKRDLEPGRDGPLRAALFTAAEHSYLFLCAHHLAVDVVSWFTIAADLLLALRGTPLSRPRTSLRQWTAAVRHLARDADAAWARTRVQATEASVPPRHPGPGLRIERTLVLAPLTAGALHRRFATDPQELLLAALALAAARHFAVQQVFTMIETHGRFPDLVGRDPTRTVGWLSSQYPIIVDARAPAESIRTAKDGLRGAPHGGLTWLHGSGSTLRPTLKLNHLARALRLLDSDAVISDLATGPDVSPHNEPTEPIEAVAWEDGDGLRLRLTFDSRWCQPPEVDAFIVALHDADRSIRDCCGEISGRTFTTSDFSTVRLDADELAALFGV